MPVHRRQGSWPLLLLLAIPALLAPGCATLHPRAYTTPIPEAVRRAALSVEVVAIPPAGGEVPQLEGVIGKGSGTGKGAASGAAAGALAGLNVTLQTGPLGVVLAPILIPVATLLGTAGGAAVGYAQALPEAEARALKEALARNQADLSRELARRVVARLPQAGKVESKDGPADLRLEVAVLSWGIFGGAGAHPTGDFRLSTSYRLLKPGGAELLVGAFTVGGPLRTFPDWGAEAGRPIQEALQDTLATSAEAVMDAAFLVQDFHIPGNFRPSRCGLAPRSPIPVLLPAIPLFGATPAVDSLQPTLQWEAFPRTEDRAEDAGKLTERLTDVRYDLRIWASVGGGRGELVYERLGLSLPVQPPEEAALAAPGPFVEHRLEVPLLPGREYLWSVRARFHLEGAERAIRWSMSQDPDIRALPASKKWFGPRTMPLREACLHDAIPPLRHHRFRTP